MPFHPLCEYAGLPGWFSNPPVVWWKINLRQLIDASPTTPVLRHRNGIISYYGSVPVEAIVGQYRLSDVTGTFDTVWMNTAYQGGDIPPEDSDDDAPMGVVLSPRQDAIAGEVTPSGDLAG
eukprot:12132293-Alexandrium_andersonii.AAC.1